MNNSNLSQKGKDKIRMSIRVKWILFICTSVFIALSGTVAFTHFTISKILEEDNTSTNKTNAENAAAQINLELKNYENSLEQLSRLISNQIGKHSNADIESLIQTVQQNNSMLISAYYMDGNTGKLHISPYMEFKKDVRETRTYTTLTKKLQTQWMDVYKDVSSGKIMTSVITPVMKNGRMIGALGYDIDLSTIGAARERIEKYSHSNLVILDSQGIIVSSFMKDADGKNMNPVKSGTVDGVKDLISDSKQFHSKFSWIDKIYHNDNHSSQSITWDDKEYTGQITTIPELNWKVLSFTPRELFLSKLDQIKQTAMISIALGLLIGALCAVYLAGKLKQIISNLQKALRKTASGDLVTEFVVKSNDEIGDLSKSYNEMLSNIRELISKVNENVSSVHQATNGLNVIAAENNTAISEVSRSIEEITMGASNQSEQVEDGSSAIQDLSNEIEELIKQSDAIELVMKETSDHVETGKNQVGNLESSYQKLELAFERVTSMIAKLNEKSKMISDVTYAISNIAEQTNLLSLNASIEAARAGEHGKGFAVVANEVRNLADDSRKATNNIQQIINSVLTDTDELVEVMTETNQISYKQKDAVTTVSDSMAQITVSLEKILGSIEEETKSINSIKLQKEVVVGMITEISAVSQQTTASAEEIASSMEEQAASSNELAQYTTQLTTLIKELENAVGNFHVGDNRQ